MRDVTAIILGGGRGTRLFPLTLERSKPAVPFAGKFRLIDVPLSNCINSGLTKIFVLTQFLSASMHRHIMRTYTFDHFRRGFVDILAAEQTPERDDWFQGTSDAVRATLNHTLYYDTEQVVILSGDHLYRMDYSQLVAFHRERGAEITLGVYPVPRAEAPRMGLMKADADGRVTEFVEKPQDPEVIDRFAAPAAILGPQAAGTAPRYLASMGIYVFEARVLRELLADAAQTDFGGEVIPGAIGAHRVLAYPFTDYWRDIGTIDAFFDANLELVGAGAPFDLHRPGWPTFTRTRSLPPARVVGSEIHDAIVAEGATVAGADINNSVVGVRAQVREGAVLQDVILMGSDFYEGERRLGARAQPERDAPPMGVGRDCRLERCIVDKNARIGDGVVITNHEGDPDTRNEHCWIRDGITIVPKGTVIPPGTRL